MPEEQQKVTFCRICEAHCGMVATVEDGRRVALPPRRSRRRRGRGQSGVALFLEARLKERGVVPGILAYAATFLEAEDMLYRAVEEIPEILDSLVVDPDTRPDWSSTP